MRVDQGERARLDLFLYSRGGASDVPWTLVSMFREHAGAGLFSVLLPYRAHSAATVISLGADHIVMTRKAELGPIDATIQVGPYNPTEGNSLKRLPVSVEDVNGYFRMLKSIGCNEVGHRLTSFGQLTNQVHPLALGAVNRLLEETKLVGLRLLSTRTNAYTRQQNVSIIRKLSQESYSHQHTICRSEAVKYIGLRQVQKAEDLGIETELWSLYTEYRDLLQLESPFLPEEHLIAKNLESSQWQNLNLACIESRDRADIRRASMNVLRLRAVPPTVNINLSQIAFPNVNIPSLPQGLTPEQIAGIIRDTVQGSVQAVLTAAAEAAATRLLQSFPQKDFQKVVFDSRWDTEV